MKTIEIYSSIVGRVGLLRFDEERYICMLIGDKEYRCKEIGSKVLESFISNLRYKGIQHIHGLVYQCK